MGAEFGCFSLSSSMTLSVNFNTHGELSASRTLSAAEILPSVINFEKIREVSSDVRAFLDDTNLPWIYLTSRSISFISPFFHSSSLRIKHSKCSFDFDLADGFCNIKDGRIINALSAIEFSFEMH